MTGAYIAAESCAGAPHRRLSQIVEGAIGASTGEIIGSPRPNWGPRNGGCRRFMEVLLPELVPEPDQEQQAWEPWQAMPPNPLIEHVNGPADEVKRTAAFAPADSSERLGKE